MKVYLGITLCLALLSARGLAQQTKPAEQVTVPAAQSARWHYERALIYHLRELDGRATIELYKAIEKDPDYTEANFFLGLLFVNREHWGDAANRLDRAVSVTLEHLPARLLLARARVENGDYFSAITALEQIADRLKLGNEFLEKTDRCRSDLLIRPTDTKSAEKIRLELKGRIESLVEDAEDAMLTSPEFYQSVTVARGLKDPLIYNELAELYTEQDEQTKSLAMLQESLAARDGFAPAVLMQMGRIYQKQERYADAVIALERAVKQLTALGFSEAAGDFSTEELQQLRMQAKTKKQ